MSPIKPIFDLQGMTANDLEEKWNWQDEVCNIRSMIQPGSQNCGLGFIHETPPHGNSPST